MRHCPPDVLRSHAISQPLHSLCTRDALVSASYWRELTRDNSPSFNINKISYHERLKIQKNVTSEVFKF